MGTKITPLRTHRPGSTLLMALLVLATVFIIVSSLAEVVRLDVVSGRSADYSVVASYAAESSLEEGLYQLRKNNATVSSINNTSLTISNSASWTRIATSVEPNLYIPYLKKDTNYAFDLYDPEVGLQSNKESLVLTPNCNAGDWIEVGYTSWTPSTQFTSNFQKFRYSCPGGGASIYINDITAANAYRMYVRSLTNDIYGITVVACSGDNGAGTCDMLGRVRLTATGYYNGAKRALSVSMPRSTTVSGLFSYTIFTECQLIKDPTQPNPPC